MWKSRKYLPCTYVCGSRQETRYRNIENTIKHSEES